ncbi:MAG: iron-sulfur cluster assembly scaffold protein [Novosphingobium sp.]|uniref:iron-sulfur cluster assembly scaffold protein n=1 Tax=Tsuneonella sp. CC-YZS046 TaxID=3042152 RepID=UPI002D7888AF|nr:iron-sulfur cluster assembly scaffold protein [Tsuneonella sp. CC-YZS046]WRO67721.1 iron-sulfur cluster assembly scaffold protein [Tsuneonella sp. CC-YZS046]
MSDPAARLYTPEMLALALRLAEYPLLPDLPLTGFARSPMCGSRIEMALSLGQDGKIENRGLRVQACAVGQAACTIFADAAPGLGLPDLLRTQSDLESWLAGDAPLPDWPGLAAIESAQAFRGRHGAILLPWKAAIHALCKQDNNR